MSVHIRPNFQKLSTYNAQPQGTVQGPMVPTTPLTNMQRQQPLYPHVSPGYNALTFSNQEISSTGLRENYSASSGARACCSSPYTSWGIYRNGVCVLNKSPTGCSLVQNQTDCKNVGYPDATFLPQAFDSEKIWTYGTQPPNLCLTMPIANGYPCHDLQPCPNVGYTQAKSKQDCIDHVQNLPKPKPVAWYVPPDVPGKSYNCFGDDLAPNGGINLNCIAQDWTPIRVSDGAHAQWCPPRKPPPPRAVGREPPPM